MGDKLKPGVVVVTTFADGEQPSAAKLNSLGAQLKAASAALEKAIGDVHSQSFPYIPTAATRTLSQAWGKARIGGADLGLERKLDIANLARLVGPASNLNPRMQESASITENIPSGTVSLLGADAASQHGFSLSYPPVGPIDGSNPTFTEGAPTAFITFVADETAIKAAGEYSVDEEGRVYTVTPLAGGTVTYTHDPLAVGGSANYSYASFNQIPDANQIAASGLGCAVGTPSGGLTPFTLPLCTHQQSDFDGTASLLTTKDLNYQKQLTLPKVLEGLTAGTRIPDGFLFLKNETTSEVYECAEYFYLSTTAIDVGNQDFTTEITDGDVFSIITVGTDITTSIDDLRNKMRHTHDRTFGEPFVELPGMSGMTHMPGNSGAWTASKVPGNFAPQYLHRDGWVSGVDDSINDQNAMRGPLIMGKTGEAAGSVVATGDSYKLVFGSIPGLANESSVYREDNDLVLRVKGNVGLFGNFNGVRVQDAPLYTTEGIQGHQVATTLAQGTPLNLYSREIIDAVPTVLFPITFDLDALSNGALVGKNIFNFDILVQEPATTDWYSANAFYPTGGTLDYQMSAVLDGSIPSIDLYFIGNDWVPHLGVSANIRFVVWYA